MSELKRWVIIYKDFPYAFGDTEILAWYNFIQNEMNQSLANPIHTVCNLSERIEMKKQMDYRAVEKTYREVEE